MRLHYFQLVSICLLAVLAEQIYANELLLADVVILDIADTAKAKQELGSNGGPVSAPANATTPSPSTIDIKEETPLQFNPAKAIKSTPIKTTSTLNKKSLTAQTNTNQPKQYELHGRINNKYVYLVIEKTKDNQVTGYLFDGKGKKKYIYGEWSNNTLQIYDTSKSKSTVTFEDDPAAGLESAPKQERASPIFEKNQSVIIKDSKIVNSNISEQSRQKNQDSNTQPQAGLINIK